MELKPLQVTALRKAAMSGGRRSGGVLPRSEYLVKKGADCRAIEHQMHELLDARLDEYPAEHNVGHLYEAKPALEAFYRSLDPTNSFNPGIGWTSRRLNWAE